MKKILLLGHTGKLGVALCKVFKDDFILLGKNSRDFDAFNFDSIETIIRKMKPDIVINTVAYMGIDPCENNPSRAIKLNAFLPYQLSCMANQYGFLLIHFSTDSVFGDDKDGFYTEGDKPNPLNIYGQTKYAGDLFVQSVAQKYYIFRTSILFGESRKKNQFVEKMMEKIRSGARQLSIADDIICSPSYSMDIALEIKRIVNSKAEYGLYHVVNAGKASLYDLVFELTRNSGLDVDVKRASHKDFLSVGRKNTNTPLASRKNGNLRPWRESIADYLEKSDN